MSEETKSQSPEPAHPKTSKCKYCKKEIEQNASKCNHCGEYQNYWRLFVFLPLIMLIIATVQVLEAHKKYVDASDALRIANSASEDVNKASVEAKRMVTEIKTILDGTEKKVAELDRSIQDGNKAVAELQLLTRFNTVVISAQNDDRDAYDQLWAWSDDNSFLYQKIAFLVVDKILADSTTFFDLNPNLEVTTKIPWKAGVVPDKLTTSELWEAYKRSSQRIRLSIVYFLWNKRPDIPQKERLQFLVDVLKNDKNMEVIRFAGHYFDEGAHDGRSPASIKRHLEWWEKNKETIK